MTPVESSFCSVLRWLSRPEALAALFTALSALGAFLAAWATKRAAQGQILWEMLKDYASPDMSDALRTLRAWRERQGEGFALKWASALSAGDLEAQAVDRARRRVTSYFENADQLRSARLISRCVLRHAVDKQGLAVLIEVSEPLERQLSPSVDLAFIARLKRLCPTRTKLLTAIPLSQAEGEK